MASNIAFPAFLKFLRAIKCLSIRLLPLCYTPQNVSLQLVQGAAPVRSTAVLRGDNDEQNGSPALDQRDSSLHLEYLNLRFLFQIRLRIAESNALV